MVKQELKTASGFGSSPRVSKPSALQVIAPCLGKHYSGINASMLAVLPELAKRVPIAALGFHMPADVPQISFCAFVRHCWKGPYRIWHARRNTDMLAGLILRHVFRFPLVLLFTSAAQRRHSWITRFCYHRMDGLIAPTAAAASFLDREAVVVPHGVDTERFSPMENRASEWAKLGLPGRYGIGVFGRIRPQKGTEEFVEAMIRVLPHRPDWTAVIVGQTAQVFQPFEKQLRVRLRQADLENRVHFTGYIKDPRDIPQFYRSLSVVVCPSRVEGFGLPCLEAMASGCPVVATHTGAWPELITEGRDGYLVPCEDSWALAEAILTITEDPERIRRMGQHARDKVTSRYRIENEAEGILSFYKQYLPDVW
jgi:glycosyltransferase involved in cell wall biosynthesis